MNEYENADKKQQDIIDDINDYNKQEIDLEPVYSEKGAEDNIAPAELFEYEIINDGSVASSYMQNLPTKTAKITGIKPEYIEIQSKGSLSWYYKIKYDGITDVLVIPYEVQLDENANVTENGEMYKITEVDLSVSAYSGEKICNGTSFPSVKKVIFPNTVEKIERRENISGKGTDTVPQPSEIVLSKNLKNIGYGAFDDTSIRSIELPESVTSIGNNAFACQIQSIEIPANVQTIGDKAFWSAPLTSIEIPESVTSIGESAFEYCMGLESVFILGKIKTIEDYTFSRCDMLVKIELPDSITNIDEYAFKWCNNLKEIVIPESIENIAKGAFYDWNSDQTIYFECSEDKSKNWDTNWKSNCEANIVWNYKPDGTTE